MSDEMGLAASHNNIGIIHENTGDYSSAERHYRQALELAGKTGFWEVETAVLANLGQLAQLRGNLTEAIDFACRSLHGARRSHDLRSEAIVLDNLGNAHLALGGRTKPGPITSRPRTSRKKSAIGTWPPGPGWV
jgi:tetratricopeptide (TPR) repeat protein